MSVWASKCLKTARSLKWFHENLCCQTVISMWPHVKFVGAKVKWKSYFLSYQNLKTSDIYDVLNDDELVFVEFSCMHISSVEGLSLSPGILKSLPDSSCLCHWFSFASLPGSAWSTSLCWKLQQSLWCWVRLFSESLATPSAPASLSSRAFLSYTYCNPRPLPILLLVEHLNSRTQQNSGSTNPYRAKHCSLGNDNWESLTIRSWDSSLSR